MSAKKKTPFAARKRSQLILIIWKGEAVHGTRGWKQLWIQKEIVQNSYDRVPAYHLKLSRWELINLKLSVRTVPTYHTYTVLWGQEGTGNPTLDPAVSLELAREAFKRRLYIPMPRKAIKSNYLNFASIFFISKHTGADRKPSAPAEAGTSYQIQ